MIGDEIRTDHPQLMHYDRDDDEGANDEVGADWNVV